MRAASNSADCFTWKVFAPASNMPSKNAWKLLLSSLSSDGGRSSSTNNKQQHLQQQQQQQGKGDRLQIQRLADGKLLLDTLGNVVK
jgi:hypothetical protein